MNKVITINLNGNAYLLEEDGYEALRAYLENAGRRLGDNPDKAEIIADIEQSIADKFRAALGPNKTVVTTAEVGSVIAAMGPVQDEGGGQPAGAAPGPEAGAGAQTPQGTRHPRRLFRIREGSKIGGVCNGLAAYFGIEPTIVRLLFVFVSLTGGAGVLIYIIMMFVMPVAETADEKAEAYGSPATADDFIRRAREGYYDGLRTFRDKKAYREWKRRFKQDMRQRGHEFHRQMHSKAQEWQHYWHGGWEYRPSPGAWIAGPILTLCVIAVSLLGCLAIFSLIFTGGVFGFFLPHNLPLWAGIVILIVLTSVLKWPLKEARHSLWYHNVRGFGSPLAHLVISVAWIGLIVGSLWFADRFFPGAHNVLMHARHDAHHAVDMLRGWWGTHPIN